MYLNYLLTFFISCNACNYVFQDYTCPYCASGFIEQLENEAEAPASGDDFSDADMSNLDDMSTIDEMSNLDDSDDMHQVVFLPQVID